MNNPSPHPTIESMRETISNKTKQCVQNIQWLWSQNVYTESRYNKFQFFNDLCRSFDYNASKSCSRCKCNRNDYFTSIYRPSVSPASSCCLVPAIHEIFITGSFFSPRVDKLARAFFHFRTFSTNVINRRRQMCLMKFVFLYGAPLSFRGFFLYKGIIGIGRKIERKDERYTEWNKLRWRW